MDVYPLFIVEFCINIHHYKFFLNIYVSFMKGNKMVTTKKNKNSFKKEVVNKKDGDDCVADIQNLVNAILFEDDRLDINNKIYYISKAIMNCCTTERASLKTQKIIFEGMQKNPLPYAEPDATAPAPYKEADVTAFPAKADPATVFDEVTNGYDP